MNLNFLKLSLLFFVNTPFYPHWLNNLKSRELEKKILKNLHGSVLEVGAGDNQKRNFILKNNQKIKKYIASDYSSWDTEFARVENLSSKINSLGSIFFGFKDRGKLDLVCDAMNLPFKKPYFDFHLSFEVLEHISNPFKYFSEASRVVRKGGKIILSVPVFYRVHGVGDKHEFDYFRYMPGFFQEIAKINNLKLENIYFNTGLGTTMAQMINQFLIEKFRFSNIFFKLFILLISLFVFPMSNIFGYILDLFPDIRFSNRYFVVFKKVL